MMFIVLMKSVYKALIAVAMLYHQFFIYFPFFLTFPVHLCVVVYLLYLKLQWSSMATLFVLVSIPITMGFSVLYSKLR